METPRQRSLRDIDRAVLRLEDAIARKIGDVRLNDELRRLATAAHNLVFDAYCAEGGISFGAPDGPRP